jgi:Zn-dependent M28 family amino/carboxypeptidase
MTRAAVPSALSAALVLGLAACPASSTGTGTGTIPAPDPVAAVDAPPAPPAPPAKELALPEEKHLKNVRQLTFGGENAEAYWAFAGGRLTLQSTHGPYACDQIFTLDVNRALAGGEKAAEMTLVSTGKGVTTCAHYLKGDQEIVYASTHEASPECPPKPDHSMGYVWALYPGYEIYRANADGTNLRKLTDSPRYDAEATVCAKDGSIVFTSMRDGDLELYKMDADGKNVVRLTRAVGYDGGAFFSADCSKIIWRASRPTGDALADYQRLLAQDMVRPTRLELFIANADGSDARQVTYLDAAAFAPFLDPTGKRILFSTNYPGRGREFDIWAIDVDGTDLERITYSEGFDGFPMFSPDGKQLVFASNRRDTVDGADGTPAYRVTGGKVGKDDTNVFVADWVDGPVADAAPSAADRFHAAVAYLADDAREGRGLGTKGLAAAADYVEQELRAAGVEPGAAAGSFRQSFEVTTAIQRGPGTRLVIDGAAVAADGFVPLSFSGKGPVTAAPVRAGWGITDAKVAHDDYKAVKARAKIAVVHRFTPGTAAFEKDNAHLRLGDLEQKAFTARKNGAAALIVVDDGDAKAEEAKLPELEPRRSADAGIPVIAVTRAVAAQLAAAKSVEIAVELVPVRTPTDNVIGVIRAAAPGKRPPGILVVGAHLDHLGPGAHQGSLEGTPTIHNGADDNASGIAALLEVARTLAADKTKLARDVYVVAFSGEEDGLLGSAHMVKHMPVKQKVVAMLNMDMVGRMRMNQLLVLGPETAPEWKGIIEPACTAARVECSLSGSGYGPSDQMSFYVNGSPVLHFFTGGHVDYHKGSDDTRTINAAGGAKVGEVVAAVTAALAAPKPPKLTYKKIASPMPRGDMRRRGASLGTIPSYADDPSAPPGMLIDDVMPGGAAQKAGLKKGDRIVQIDSIEIRNVQDLMFVLQSAKPGQVAKVTVLRDGKHVTVEATYTAPKAR